MSEKQIDSLIERYHSLSDDDFLSTITDEECWGFLKRLPIYPIIVSGLYRSSGGYVIDQPEDWKCLLLALLHDRDDDEDDEDNAN